MCGVVARIRAGLSRGTGARGILLVTAVTICCLSLPTVASASSVSARHHRAFKAYVKEIVAQEKSYRDDYNGYATALETTAAEIKRLMAAGDASGLAVQEQQAQQQADAYSTAYGPVAQQFKSTLKSIRLECRNWFMNDRDELQFKDAMDKSIDGVQASSLACHALSVAFGYLASANIDEAQQANDTATKYITKATPKIKEGLAELKALE
jgi:hypothetical protein